MKFEKFYLLDYRGDNNRISLRFKHITNGKELDCNTEKSIYILQTQEIQVKTQFVTDKIIKKYVTRNNRNLRNLSLENKSTINVYYIPVVLDVDNNKYIFASNNEIDQ